jgi:hypothetical protein
VKTGFAVDDYMNLTPEPKREEGTWDMRTKYEHERDGETKQKNM